VSARRAILAANFPPVPIRNGNIEAHQQRVTRNYALTCLFITARILKAFPIPDRYEDAPDGF